jgi:hypothetical protein
MDEVTSRTPLADALAEVDKAQSGGMPHGARQPGELAALRELAERVRLHLMKHPEPVSQPVQLAHSARSSDEWQTPYATAEDYAAYAAERMNEPFGMDDTEAVANGTVITFLVHGQPDAFAVFGLVTGTGDGR